ncbi:3-hydroxyacyl-ACP dehydratase FabZ [Gynuella sunshinyii]|uniref:3-hydroxyacyl-[acyl-carrier-protein] dehydratase FabZ n=1 Tax=Gynuella sunshinyii YC6258 TaxID=1445510 RepID=A0A0C5VW61_9GAMM|nr:3-hydroxyacyl-ACP dehydratase FabZ [Gynuella sunshinyii]AJQ94684.1 3-hydroxymyristoyl/3-hydroxydecanoyl-(acyl carrier protein) dehydratase [Gynuella sunshinyii YC6258]
MTDIALPLNHEDIKKILPHRYPLLLVDRITELEIGNYVKGYKNVTGNEDVFNGHFPRLAVFPGVMICEALAQVAGVLGYLTSGHKSEEGYLVLFAGLDNVRFKRQVIPGDRMDMEAKLIASKRGIHKVDAQAYVDGELACSAELMFAERKV